MTRRERLERKIEQRQEWAGKAAARSEQRFNAAGRIADIIPLGQPILVGHHSEGRARRDAARIRTNMDKGVAEYKLAAHHTSKAGGLADQLERSVFSDDVAAIEQLEARIAEREVERDRMKRVNALYKKGDAAGLADMGLKLEELKSCVAAAGWSWVKAPYVPYQLTNLGARIRSDRERIEQIRQRAARTERADAAGGVMVEGEENVRVTFAEKPERAVLDALKAAGFAWGGGSWFGRRDRLPDEMRRGRE